MGARLTMSFLRRLLGGSSQSQPVPSITLSATTRYDATDELAVVTVAGAQVPATIYQNFQRDRQDWSSGIRLEDPETGGWMRETGQFPDYFRAAGAMSIAVAGISHHPDASRDDFAVGHLVRLVPEPSNAYDPNAIAIRSADGRYHAGYVPAEDLDGVRAVQPAPTVGLVAWENFTWRPRQRIGIRLLIGPSVSLHVVPTNQRAKEAARRETVFAAGQQAERRRYEQEHAEREARERQVAHWRTEGRCIECGAPIEPRGRFVRCASCRHAQRQSPSS
jgi:hypothetical protein